MTNEELIACIRAEMEGKQVQMRSDISMQWRNKPRNEGWDTLVNCYRIEPPRPPRPLELWVNLYKGSSASYPTIESALSNARPGCIRTVRMREVTDD